MFKKYLNPSLKPQYVPPSSTRNAVQKSMQFQALHKKKVKAPKNSKKNVNYTTIRKQIPSFERSVDSETSGIKILKYPKMSVDISRSSKSGSKIMHADINNTIKNLTDKSLNLSNFKIPNDTKAMKSFKFLKTRPKKSSKSKKKEGVSKWEIDLSKLQGTNSSRGKNQSFNKEYHSVLEEIKTMSSHKSKSPDYSEKGTAREDTFPMNPGKALKLFMNNELTPYEQSEILDYKLVYFIGKTDKKIDGSKIKSNNDGYDDNRGDYKIVQHDHIGYRYEIIQVLGQGSFGQVIKVYDHKHKKNLALKIIRNKKKFEYQAKIEIKVLKDIRDNDPKDKSNIIKLIDNFVFRKHHWLTFDLFSMNLFELIKSNDYRGFPLDIVRRFAVQILQGLRFLKKRNIIHCDLKPENILLKKDNKTGIKIIDLGSSWFANEQVYTYIQSRFYRSPEIMLGIPYTPAIDMWSFACLLVELYIGYPLFPGESEEEQFSLIMEYKGIPPINILEAATRKELFLDKDLNPLHVKDSLGEVIKANSKALSKLLKWGVSSKDSDSVTTFIKFIDACLHWDPELRMTPSEALHHEWISSIFGSI